MAEFLHLSIVEVLPSAGTQFAYNRIYAYDITFTADAPFCFTDNPGLLLATEVAYGNLPLPTFTLGASPEARSSNFVYASCRKLYAPGRDATVALNQHLSVVHRDRSVRPSALFLVGDQIYADDVNATIAEGLISAAQQLLPENLPDGRLASDIRAGTRAAVVAGAGFTSTASANHLMSFGEFVTMYLLAWSPTLWQWNPGGRLPSAVDEGVVEMRRILANVSTYMMLDDHEVSDDWPMTQEMWENVAGNPVGGTQGTPVPLGGWVVANSMAAAWLFQLWGNDPSDDGRHNPLLRGLRAYLTASGPNRLQIIRSYVQTVLGNCGFGYTAPTSPPVVVLDTRTQRALNRNWFPGLLNNAGFGRLATQISQIGASNGAPLIVVSPACVIGYRIVEWVARPRAGVSYENDTEQWSYNPNAYLRLLTQLANASRTVVVILSGDVHFGYAALGTFHDLQSNRWVDFLQLTSSALRNEMSGWNHFISGIGRGWGSGGYVAFDRADNGSIRTRTGTDALSAERNTQATLNVIYYQSAERGATALSELFTHNNFGIVRVSWTSTSVAVNHQLKGVGFDGDTSPIILPSIAARHGT